MAKVIHLEIQWKVPLWACCFLTGGPVRPGICVKHILSFPQKNVDKLEPSCCKKQQKKSQPRDWFGKKVTSEGSEWYQIGPKWVSAYLEPILYYLEASDIP